MRLALLLAISLILPACESKEFVYYTPPDSEYEQGMAYCEGKPSEDFKNLCRFHWRLAYAEKYSLAWADYPF